MEMNENMINKTVDDAISTVNFLCKNDLSYLELTSKLDVLNDKMDTLQTLVVYSNDENFTKTVCAVQIITNNLNNEISKELGHILSSEFRENQLDFLRNISKAFEIQINEVENVPSVKSNDLKKEYKNKIDKTREEYKEKTTKETIDEIINDTNEKLNSYFESEKDIKEFLYYMSKFHNYSIGNCSLIEKQFSGSVAVGSFKFWKDKGFSVNKGEKGIQILVPAPVKMFIDENNEKKAQYMATKEQKQKIKNGLLKETDSKTNYRKGYVFDISQTNAKSEDLPKIFPNKWLDGEINNYNKMYKDMSDVADNLGVNIITPKSELGVSKGISYTLTKEVALNPRNSQIQNVKTLLHELAHAKLHTKSTQQDYSTNEKEFQAEMVAYSICSYFGIDTSDYSLSYLHNYTKNSDIKEKRKLLGEIKSTVNEFIEIIEVSLSKEMEIDKSIEVGNEIEYETSEEMSQAIADVIDSEVVEDKIYTKFIWSENEIIQDNSVFEFEDANNLIETLTQLHIAKNNRGYDKTKFELHFNKECTDKFYTGRFDIGDGYADNLKEHIYKSVSEIHRSHNISTNQKRALFDTLGINKSKSISQPKKDIRLEL